MKNFPLQLIIALLVLIRYDLPNAICKGLMWVKEFNSPIRFAIILEHYKALFDPYHPYNID